MRAQKSAVPFFVLAVLLGLAGPFLPAAGRGFAEGRAAKADAPSQVVGVVERRMGAVFAVHPGERSRAVLDMGERVFDGDRVLTETGRAHVRFRDGTFCELGENSAMQVERVFQRKRRMFEGKIPLSRADESVYRFEKGLLRMTAIQMDLFQEYTLKTDCVLIRVEEPSDFLVANLEKSARCDVQMLSGKAALMNIITNESQELKAGYSATFKPSGALQAMRKLSSEETAFLKQRTGI